MAVVMKFSDSKNLSLIFICMLYIIVQLKYTIESVSKILVPRGQTYFPRRL
jgi:hypothetical protein